MDCFFRLNVPTFTYVSQQWLLLNVTDPPKQSFIWINGCSCHFGKVIFFFYSYGYYKSMSLLMLIMFYNISCCLSYLQTFWGVLQRSPPSISNNSLFCLFSIPWNIPFYSVSMNLTTHVIILNFKLFGRMAVRLEMMLEKDFTRWIAEIFRNIFKCSAHRFLIFHEYEFMAGYINMFQVIIHGSKLLAG